MDSGIIGLVDGDFDADDLDDWHDVTETRNGFELESAIEIQQRQQVLGGKTLVTGQAYMETIEEQSRYYVDGGGKIRHGEKPTVVGYHTWFATIPGEVVVVDSSDGELFFDVLYWRYPIYGVEVRPAEIRLNDFYSALESPHSSQLGFAHRPGYAEKGVVYGSSLEDDEGMADEILSSRLNQLTVEMGTNAGLSDVYLAESGYVDVYSGMSSFEFCEFLAEYVLPHTDGDFEDLDDEERSNPFEYDPDEDDGKDKSEKAEEDDSQTSLDDLKTVEMADGSGDTEDSDS